MSDRPPEAVGGDSDGATVQTADLDALSARNDRDFVTNAYRVVLGRLPTSAEQDRMLAALLRGDAKTWLLGTLRYGDEGNARGVSIAGLRLRYLAQRLFRAPGVGPLFEWLNAVARLPRALRHLRAVAQADSIARAQNREADRALLVRLSNTLERLERAHDAQALLAQKLQARLDEESTRLVETRTESAATRARVDAISAPVLHDTLEIQGPPLVDLAKARAGIPATTPIDSLSPHARYALFETVFYESPAVEAKQRAYLPYVDRELASRFPFLDLGCGRGEFLRILRGEGIATVGVDSNPVVLAPLRAAGFDVVEQDLLQFLLNDRRTYCGASMLQVAEHLTNDQIERALALLAPRLAPRAVLIVETPNPLSPFALAVFHTDPTHVAPLPPERVRYTIEAAGFEDARTLFQARVPQGQFAGPDPLAYYGDYAVIARRCDS